MVKCGELDLGSVTEGTGCVQPEEGSTESWWLRRRWKHLHKDDP